MDRKIISIIVSSLIISLLLLGCGNTPGTKAFIGLKVEGMTMATHGKVLNTYTVKALYFDGKKLEAKEVALATTTTDILRERNFSMAGKVIYMYLPPKSEYKVIDNKIMQAYILLYYNDNALGEGITPIHGGYIASWNKDYVEVYIGDTKVISDKMPWSGSDQINFVATGYEESGKIYLIWGYSRMTNKGPDTTVQIKNITDGVVYQTSEVKNCFVSGYVPLLYADIEKNAYTYQLCQREDGSAVLLKFSTTDMGFDLREVKKTPDKQWQVDGYKVKVVPDNTGQKTLYINGKQVDKARNEYSFYIIRY